MLRTDPLFGNLINMFRTICAICVVFLSGCASYDAGVSTQTLIAETAPKEPAYVPDDVLGASAENVDRMFGAPELTRREGAGEYRRYGLRKCMLVVIFYPDAAGFVRASHVDAVSRHSSLPAPDVDRCLAFG